MKAVEENPEIKVWNLSLGSRTQISQNTISYIAAELDRLQANRKDLVFVVAATNKPRRILGDMFIGSPPTPLILLLLTHARELVALLTTLAMVRFFHFLPSLTSVLLVVRKRIRLKPPAYTVSVTITEPLLRLLGLHGKWLI